MVNNFVPDFDLFSDESDLRIIISLILFLFFAAVPVDNSSLPLEDISFNERFSWLGAHEMGESYQAALYRGLPFPILTVAEYFSLGQEGFAWGGQYRAAGYYGSIFLW